MNWLKIFLFLVIIGCFNALFYIFQDTDNKPSEWITYGFMNLSIIYAAIIASLDYHRSDVKMSNTMIGVIYCIAQMVVGTILLLIAPETTLWVLLLQLVILGMALGVNLFYLMMDRR